VRPVPFNVELYEQIVGGLTGEERPNRGRRGRPPRRRRQAEEEGEWEEDSFEEELAEMRRQKERDLEIARLDRAERIEKRRLALQEDNDSSEALRRPKRLKYKGSPPKPKSRRRNGFASNWPANQGRGEDGDKENFYPLISREDIIAHANPQNLIGGFRRADGNARDGKLRPGFKELFAEEDEDSDVVKRRRKWQKKREKFRNSNKGVVAKSVFLNNLMAGEEEPQPARPRAERRVAVKDVERVKVQAGKARRNLQVLARKERKETAGAGRRRGQGEKRMSRLEEIEMIEEQRRGRGREATREMVEEMEVGRVEKKERTVERVEKKDRVERVEKKDRVERVERKEKKERGMRGKLKRLVVEDEEVEEERRTPRERRRQSGGRSRLEELEALDGLGKRKKGSAQD
jgi:hypothetical protein